MHLSHDYQYCEQCKMTTKHLREETNKGVALWCLLCNPDKEFSEDFLKALSQVFIDDAELLRRLAD